MGMISGDGKRGIALFQLGFRPFFWGASLFALLSMALWMLLVLFGMNGVVADIPAVVWHGHAMIYGYGVAVVAGFLLTAVRNWTGIATLNGTPLQGMVALWFLARLAPLLSGAYGLQFALLADTLWIGWLAVALTYPVVRAKRWKNLLVISLLYGLLAGQLLFALGVLGMVEGSIRIGLWLGLYLLLALILLLAGRVMPMFIRNGVGTSFLP